MAEIESEKKRSLWWLMPVGLLVAMVAGQLWMGYTAVNDPGFAVEKNYYKKALHWDEHEAQIAENQRLGWQIALDAEPVAGADHRMHLVVRLSDRRGKPLYRARVKVETFFNARAGHLLNATLTEAADGSYHASLPMQYAGLWEFRFTATHGGERFTDVIRRDIGVRGGA